MKNISRFLLSQLGWTLDEQQPQLHRYVMIGYPHTSNWDFIMGMLGKWALGIPLNWVAKKSMFKGPFRYLFVAMGGVPIDRNKTTGFIQKNIELFDQRESFILGIMPEGTRSRTDRLKTGFYHIAKGANVPLALAYMDYKNKKIGIGKVMDLTGNIDKDFEVIKAFYINISGFKPQNQSELTIKCRKVPAE